VFPSGKGSRRTEPSERGERRFVRVLRRFCVLRGIMKEESELRLLATQRAADLDYLRRAPGVLCPAPNPPAP
jgi:hypothetical protein